MKKYRVLWALLPILFFAYTASSQSENVPANGAVPPFLENSTKWADSVFNAMSPDERLGQLFMVAAYSNKGPEERQQVANLIQKYHVGGLIFMQGGPGREASLTNYYQSVSRIPLMMSIDGEWGLAMRLDSTISFPRQQMLGAIQNDSLIYEMGAEIARQCKRIGINIDFAPDVDINSNPLNPVIGDRSFGDNKYNVARKGIAYAKGLQDNGVLACAKHFPGHGDTDKDSHKTLPTVAASAQQLDTLELYPFREMINAGVGGVMVAHLFVPALDTTTDRASTLSKPIVTDLLKTKMSFQGLTFTDALNMHGVTNYYFEPGQIDLMALLAGNDVLLFSGDVGAAISQIKSAVTAGKVTQEEVDRHIKKILQAKYWMGLNHWTKIDTKNIYADLNSPSATLLKQQLIENALTLVRNKDKMIPFKGLESYKMAAVAIGGMKGNKFQEQLKTYTTVKDFQIDKLSNKASYTELLRQLKGYNCVFVSLHGLSKKADNDYAITETTRAFLDSLSKQTKVVLTIFGTPYALKFFENKDWLLEAYNDDPITESMAAQLLFGGIRAKGTLPLNASPAFKFNDGSFTMGPIRFKYTIPEEVGIEGTKLARIDSMVNEAISKRAFPGCQVLVAKDGKVIYNKSFGFFTYDNIDSVRNEDIYDLASVTKIAATTLAVMNMYDNDMIDLVQPVSTYLPDVEGSNKQNLLLREFLTHQAGLKAWIPFYKQTLDKDGNLKPYLYSPIQTGDFSVRVTKNIYMNKNYIDTMWEDIIKSPVVNRGTYLYSDLDFFFLKAVVEKVSGIKLDKLVNTSFYYPMGLPTMGYNPTDRFPLSQIVPSNYDNSFRKELIQGFVHDPGAAMEGGVEGHAGLFSNANDLAVVQQMLLNGGMYGGVRFIKESTVEKFTTQASKICRRGLGFDKPEPDQNKASPCCKEATCNTYGHQGFTGTCVWTDPVYGLIFVFLSNRTFPDDENQKINNMNVRKNVQAAIYQSFLN